MEFNNFYMLSLSLSYTRRVRGTLNTILVVATSGGTLIGLLAGHFLGYAEAPRIFLLFPVLFIVLYSFMPETPYYLMKINRMEVCTCSFYLLLFGVFLWVVGFFWTYIFMKYPRTQTFCCLTCLRCIY